MGRVRQTTKLGSLKENNNKGAATLLLIAGLGRQVA